MIVTAAVGATILGLQGSLFLGGTFNQVLVVAGASATAYGLLSVAFRFGYRAAPKTSRLDLAKLNRRREVIEERLKKLETLRAADPESLLRNRGNN